MTDQTLPRLLILAFFIITTNVVFILCDCQYDRVYAIRSVAAPALAVDASEQRVKVKFYNGKPQQLWKFECGNMPGLLFIVNLNSGKVLDTDRKANTLSDVTPRVYVFTNEKDGSLYQQWYVNENSHITNAAWRQELDILNATYIPGRQMQIFQTNTWPTQNFTLIEVY